jgi:Zn-dependent peptidase ImmA (M78 family)
MGTSHSKPPYNPEMLRWAREWRGRSLEDAAKKVAKTPTVIAAWEDVNSPVSPTVNQARTLAEYYNRAFLEFFLPNPPKISAPEEIVDYRLYTGMTTPEPSWELTSVHQWTEAQRNNALSLFAELGEQPPEIPTNILCRISDNPDLVAARVRGKMSFPFEEQTELTSSEADTLPSILRAKLEDFGVLTLRENQLRHLGVRGICIATFPLPAIVFANESPSAQAFTLAHELGHILLRESGISGFRTNKYQAQPVEKWCDKFAAAFLMPAQFVAGVVGPIPKLPANMIDDQTLERTARSFRVSPHAMLIRLVYLGYVNATYYWDKKKSYFDEIDLKYKSFGRPKYYGSRFKSSLGNLYTGLVIDAWSNDKITNHSAAEYMGIKKLSHLDDIRNAFRKR